MYSKQFKGDWRSAFAGASLLLISVAAAHADTPIHLSREVAPDASIVIRNVKGNVRVSGWNQNRVQVDGTLGSGAKPLQITGDAHALEIHVESADNSGWFNSGSDNGMGSTSLDVHVPLAAALEVHTVSAPVDVDGIDSRSVTVNTVSGRTHLGVRTGAIKVDSVSGDIDMSGASRNFDAQTVSGDIQAETLSGNANAQTVSGAVLLRGAAMDKVNLGTVSGRIQLAAAVAPGAAWKVDTMSGDVRLNLPATASVRIKADAFSGDLHSDFGKTISSEHGPGEHLDANIGQGSGTITVNSFSGDVHIQGGTH